MPHKLLILTGPSCVGKTPLVHALKRLYPALFARFKKLVLYNDRRPRPQEKEGIDYHFRPRAVIAGLRRKKGYLVREVRGNLIAVNIQQLTQDLKHTEVLYEGNPSIARALLGHPQLRNICKLSVFLSPLSKDEIASLKRLPSRHSTLKKSITDMMRRKLRYRTQEQKRRLSPADLGDIERRAQSAFGELKWAWRFDYVLVNHDGEESDHWDTLPFPIGEARKAVVNFSAMLQGRFLKGFEKWGKALLR